MNSSASPFTLPDTAPELAQRFCMILGGLGALVARRFLRMPHLMRFTVLLYSRLNRAVLRFNRLLTQTKRRGAPRKSAERTDRVRAPKLALPGGRGWLLRELGWEAAAYMGYLDALLADPAMQAALARAPGLGRILRPIGRMLGVAVSPAAPVAAARQNTAADGRAQLAMASLAAVGGAGLPGVAEDCTDIATSG